MSPIRIGTKWRRRLLLLLLPCLGAFCNDLKAQVIIDFSQFEKTQNVKLKMLLQNASSKEPVSYATVYIIPQGDTTITGFALSDEKGKAEIKDILPGKYEVNAEMIGYKPYKKIHDLKGWEVDLGVIDMEENPEYIDAASITALANPVVIKKDTVEYNAAAFRVGQNAMLEDLLKKMPGMEVAEDGTVKVNGEKVDKITVGGKTFFFNDPAMAVKNLPAKIVDKIKVIDKDKDEAAFSGISTKDDKEKVMDVQLKEEYTKGWFGNVKAAGGATLAPKSDNMLNDNIGALFNCNAMAAGYNDKDQITFLGSGKNANDPGGSMAYVYTDDMDQFDMKQGQVTSAQAGANYNTERIKGMESSISVNYNFSDKDSREKSARTAFVRDGSDIFTEGSYRGLGTSHKINAGIEMEKKDTKKYMLYIRPSFSFTLKDRYITNSSVTSTDGGEMNRSNSSSVSSSGIFNTHTSWNFGVKDIGKEKRNFTFAGNFQFSRTVGDSRELSETVGHSESDGTGNMSSDKRDLIYDTRDGYLATEGVLTYVEPVGELWSIQTRFTACHIRSSNDKDALNGSDNSINDRYSSFSQNKDILFRERLLAQFKKEKATVIFGAMADQEQNVTDTRSLGTENTVGKGEWIYNWAPYAEISWSTDNTTLRFNYRGNSDTPSGANIIPTLNISNPIYISAGNIYLRPSFSQWGYLNFRTGNQKKHSFFNSYLQANFTTRQIVHASWFDENGIRYAIPVNAGKPGTYIYCYLNYNFPIDKTKRWTMGFDGSLNYNGSTNYQAVGKLPGLDKNGFNYEDMMSWFWGNPEGDIFYSGASGFAESRTNTVSSFLSMNLKYKSDKFSGGLRGYASNRITKYSLDPTADMNTWDFLVNGDLMYQASKGWEFKTECRYCFYKGYSSGYGAPQVIWNAGIGKEIKAFTINLKVADILNQSKSLFRTASAEYVEDTYRNVMGRYFLIGLSFNFGKMNAKNNQKVQSALYQMMF